MTISKKVKDEMLKNMSDSDRLVYDSLKGKKRHSGVEIVLVDKDKMKEMCGQSVKGAVGMCPMVEEADEEGIPVQRYIAISDVLDSDAMSHEIGHQKTIGWDYWESLLDPESPGYGNRYAEAIKQEVLADEWVFRKTDKPVPVNALVGIANRFYEGIGISEDDLFNKLLAVYDAYGIDVDWSDLY